MIEEVQGKVVRLGGSPRSNRQLLLRYSCTYSYTYSYTYTKGVLIMAIISRLEFGRNIYIPVARAQTRMCREAN